MKILMVNKFLYPNGGSETYIFTLAEYLESKGHVVSFFGMADKRDIKSNKLDLNVSNIDFHKANILHKLVSVFKIIYSIEAKRKIIKVIKDFKPDVIHVNNFNFQLTPSILYAAKKINIPVVMTVHDYQLLCPNHMMYIERENKVCEECKGKNYKACINNSCIHDSKMRSILGAFEGWLYSTLNTYSKTIEKYIAPSKFLRNKFIDYGFNEQDMELIYNYHIVDSSAVRAFENKKYVLYFGRLSKQKGIITLLDTAKMNPDIDFVVAGTGPLEHLVDEVKNVKYVGFVKGEELVKLIGEAAFSVYPSQWYENCPLSVLESQALGTPVIGAKIGGIPELIDNNQDGILFRPGNSVELSNCIQKLYNDDELLKTYSLKCQAKAKKFDVASYYEKLLDIYIGVIEK